MAFTVTVSTPSTIIVVISCLLIVILQEVQTYEVVNVTTMTGTLSGVLDSTTNSNLFLGISYAEPPVEDLRFRAPVPKIPWEGTRTAYTHGASCPQDIRSYPMLEDLPDEAKVISEDCLTLNVYSPVGADSAAVMVWLHGGAFEFGQAAAYDGTDLTTKGVVVVTVNYRLGPLGFLSTGDNSAPGNYGLLDQLLAMQWVKDNIGEFGGDPSQVTLFGHDVGANSVMQHLTSSGSRDLFSRAILQSISSSFPAETNNAVANAKDLAAAVGCFGSEFVNCLRATPLYDIMIATNHVKSKHSEILVWSPITDSTFNTESLTSKHDVIIGFASGDGSWVLDALGQGPLSEEAWEAFSGQYLTGGENLEFLQAALNHEYISSYGNAPSGMLRLQQAVDLNTDLHFLLPTVLFLREARRTAKSVYLYIFDQQTASDNR